MRIIIFEIRATLVGTINMRINLFFSAAFAALALLCGRSYAEDAASIPAEAAQYVAEPATTLNLWPGDPPGGIPENIGQGARREASDCAYQQCFDSDNGVLSAKDPNKRALSFFPAEVTRSLPIITKGFRDRRVA